jgi:hypothetical protein
MKRPKLVKSEMKKEITSNTKEIQGIIRDYFENLHSNNWKILKK